jgi:2-keto-4-pentenoate hydratase
MAYKLEDRVHRGTATQLVTWRETLSGGAGRTGWKLGLGSPELMEKLGIPAPLVGFLTSRTTLPSGASVSLEGTVKPGIEPEVSLNIGRDLPPDADRDSLRRGIDSLSVALEFVDLDRALDEVETVAAENIFHRGVVFGLPSRGESPTTILDNLQVQILANGATVRAAEKGPDFEQMVDLVAHVNGTLSVFGEHLKAGDRIIAGTLTPIYSPSRGERVQVAITGLGEIEINFEN